MKTPSTKLLNILLACTSPFFFMPQSISASATTEETLTEGNNRFALELYQNLKAKDGNLFLSPFSISSALAMTYSGARSTTAKQMASTLHFDLPSDVLPTTFEALNRRLNEGGSTKKYQLTIANSLWGQKGYSFLPEFLKLINTHYGATFAEVDFSNETEAARIRINQWVENKTQDKIKDLLKPGVLIKDTRLVLANAIYFKGKWAAPFLEKDTKDAPFWITKDKKVNVPMMNQDDLFTYLEEETFQILELPYSGKELSMVILLPKDKDGLPALENSLTAQNLRNWLNQLSTEKIQVSLPKFKTTSEFDLGQTLSKLGMPEAFTPQADFSGINGKRDLAISAVVHKAFVDVNEEGTEAAAATGTVMTLTSAPAEPLTFRADHPFFYVIRENHSGAILFLGRVSDFP
jgi:serine protease inhibitor